MSTSHKFRIKAESFVISESKLCFAHIRLEARMIGKLGLIMVVVKDMDRSVAFYRDVLGLKLVMQHPKWTQFDCGNIQVGLHPEGEEVKVRTESGCTFGFYVDDINKTVADLKSKGARFHVDVLQEEFGLWALLADPDGYGIQIVQMSAAYAGNV
jgi:lactoylglutathione lyase